MGAGLAQTVLGVARPRVGLLSNGQEPERGSALERAIAALDEDQRLVVILRDVEDFGRRQPWVVAAAGLALGVAAARFVKASSRRR